MKKMPKKFANVLMAAGFLAVTTVAANATPNCFRDNKPYALAGDTVSWTASIAAGADCIQGLRWSYMQIESVSVANGPHNGRIELVGPGFRYFANAENQSADSFTLVVSGKNRHDAGKSTIEITIERPKAALVSDLAQ
jgi:hypothetical protein